MLEYGQTYSKNVAVFTPQGFQSMFNYFSMFSRKGLRIVIFQGLSSWLIFKFIGEIITHFNLIWKHQKTWDFLMVSGGAKKLTWHVLF